VEEEWNEGCLNEAGNEIKRRKAMRNKNINEIQSAERQNTTNETGCEFRILPDDELKGVSGGLTNGDDPRFQVFMLAAKAAFYQGMWYSSAGW
jgi:hypothetical protein